MSSSIPFYQNRPFTRKRTISCPEEEEEEMSLPLTASSIWDEIERSESYLVCCMFEEAASLASSVLERICKTDCAGSVDEVELADMMESAGMVLVQALQELGRASDMLNEVKALFGPVTVVPCQVLLTVACFQITESSRSGLQKFLSEFLGKWKYVDGQYILSSIEGAGAYLRGSEGHIVLGRDKYLEVVEVYAVKLLGDILNDMDMAIAWVEKAELPDEKRQDLVRRLRSLYSVKVTKSLQSSEKGMPDGKTGAQSGMDWTSSGYEVASGTSTVEHAEADMEDNRKQTLQKLTKRVEPCFWWYRTVNLKFGNTQLVISHGKILMWVSFMILVYYFHKKRETLKRMASRQAQSIKKALVDMWQLAFSVQVNPLAAVQPLPTTAQGSR